MSLSRASWAMRVSSNNQRSTNTACWSVLDDRLSVRVPRRARSRASRPDRNRTLSSDTSRTAVHVTLTAAQSPLRMILDGSPLVAGVPRSSWTSLGVSSLRQLPTVTDRYAEGADVGLVGGADVHRGHRRRRAAHRRGVGELRRRAGPGARRAGALWLLPTPGGHVRRPRRRHRRRCARRSPCSIWPLAGTWTRGARPRNSITCAPAPPCSPGKDRWRPPAASRTASRGPPRTR